MQQKGSRGVQQHEVSSAADALVAERLRPTIERIRGKLGRGSPNTVAPMLEVWFATLAPRLGVVTNHEDPESPPPNVRAAIDDIWRTALKAARGQASAELEPIRLGLVLEQEGISNTKAELAAQQTQLTSREELLRQSLSLAESQLEEAMAREVRLQSAVSSKDTEVDAIRQNLASLAQQRDVDRRRYDDALKAISEDRDLIAKRTGDRERRLLQDLDRVRQEALAARKEAAEAQRISDGIVREHVQRVQAMDDEISSAAVEIASLRASLAAEQRRANEFQVLFAAKPTSAVTTKVPTRRRIRLARTP